MIVWDLRPLADEPWEPWYDKAFGFVVVAPDELTARRIASEDCGDEGPAAWLDPEQSQCIPLDQEEAGVVMRDFWQA